MLVVLMLETPTAVANAFDIANVPGIDVVIVGNNDLSQFSGFAQNSPEYQAMITKIHADVKRAGKIFGQANATYAKGHPLSNDAFFFQNGPSNDGWTPPGRGGRGGRGANSNAPPAGER
jgi:4-hydroxy-2-oxoheptanedioate aldolase